MKRIGVIPIVIASFLGVLGALQVDRYLQERNRSQVEFRAAGESPVRQVSLQPSEVPAAAFDFKAASKKVSPSVVSIDRYNNMRRGFFGEGPVVEAKSGSGSGVVLTEDGIIVTNNHVVDRAARVHVRLSDGRQADAEVLGTDARSDLAVLRVKLPNLVPIEVAESRNVEVGEWVIAVGNPLGFDNTVSVGVVSSLKRNLPVGQQGMVDAIQTDAAINPGNSGGALCNAQGQLIGINSAIASGTGMSIGIGFATPVDRVKAVVQDIVKHGYVRYAGLGITYNGGLDGQLANPYFREEFKQRTGLDNMPTHGIIVMQTGGNAAKAGIKDMDILLEVDGQKIEGTFDLNRVFVPKKPGDSVSVKYWSKGETKTAKVTLQEVRNVPVPDL